jgi:hypothetical protein
VSAQDAVAWFGLVAIIAVPAGTIAMYWWRVYAARRAGRTVARAELLDHLTGPRVRAKKPRRPWRNDA